MARLIDADALKEEIDMEWCPDMAVSEIWHVIDKAQTVGGWISVKDRLPEKKGDYIAYTKDGIVWPYWFDDVWFDTLGYATDTVTHWMPLPEPPEEASVDA